MKRAVLVGVGTLVGTLAVLAYQPRTLFATTVAAPIIGAKQTTSGPASADAPSSTSSGSTQTGTKTYTGDSVETGYGPVQVQVSVSGHSITNVLALNAPQNDSRSYQISSYAKPQLEQQAMTAQSSTIDGVSGASYTSQGFSQSLQSALAQAGL